MSLERTALRLAAVMALSNGYQPPYPTMATTRVYDSRQDPIEGLEPGQLVPTIVLYTDNSDGQPLDGNNGGPPFIDTVHLVVEISLGMAREWKNQAGQPVIGIEAPQTEPELDAALDAFEWQVRRVFGDGKSTWGTHLMGVHRGIVSWKSNRFIERDAGVRLASRQIVAELRLQQEPERPIAALPDVAPFIPEPLGGLLTAIAASDSPYAASATALQQLLLTNAPDTPIPIPPTLRLRFVEARQAEANGAGVRRGPRPDGVADVILDRT